MNLTIKLSSVLLLSLLLNIGYSQVKIGSHSLKKSKKITLSKKEVSQIKWLSHKPNNSKQVKRTFQIKLLLIGDTEVKKEDIEVYLDDKLYASQGKSGETRLMFNRNKGTTFSETITQKETFKLSSKVFVKFRTKSGKVVSSEPIIFKHPQPAKRPSLHVLAIGPYHADLKYTEKDARDFIGLFVNQNEMYDNVNLIPVLSNEKATKFGIKKEIIGLKQSFKDKIIKPEDVLITFISTHGFIHKNDLRLKPYDFEDILPEESSLSLKRDIVYELEEIGCKKIVLLDACQTSYAAESQGSKGQNDDLSSAIMNIVRAKPGIITLNSSSPGQKSYESDRYENGTFTEALIEAFSTGKADTNRNKILSTKELLSYLEIRVPELNKKANKPIQRPACSDNDFLDLEFFQLK